jgi:mannose-1-phosphate guanylyltransferase
MLIPSSSGAHSSESASHRPYLFVMAGGSGTRFWPKSTALRPKQLLAFGERSLLAQTLKRFEGWIPPEDRTILTTQLLQGAIETSELPAQILAEPQGRNTAPCIYWAAQVLAQKDPTGIMLVMPSDHYIAREDRFIETVQEAVAWVKTHPDLVTLGISPSRPETGYGYLRLPYQSESSSLPIRVEAFVEKPNLALAQQFLTSGNYLWNGGMFIWRVDTLLEAFDRYMPEMRQAWEQAQGKVEQAYGHLTATSIDYGILEKAKNVVTFPLHCGWDDLGSWDSLENVADVLGIRRGENVSTSGQLLALDSTGNILDTPGRFTSLLGVKDLIIVEQGEALLIADKHRSQEIRKLVGEVKKLRPDLV